MLQKVLITIIFFSLGFSQNLQLDKRIHNNNPNEVISKKNNISYNRAGIWSEITNFLVQERVYIGVGFYYLPDLYVKNANYQVQFDTSPHLITNLQISYNDGINWTTLSSGPTTGTGLINLPYQSEGVYKLKIRYTDLGSQTYTLPFNVFVVPEFSRAFKDNSGNTLVVWSNGANNLDKPIFLIEGFDPANSMYQERYYYMSREIVNRVKKFGEDILILNFVQGGDDIRNNADVVDGAIRFVKSIQQGDEKIILAGLSMGGIVGRYCLAKAEQNNSPLPVSHFLSIDSPQQYATIDKNLLDMMKEKNSASSIEKQAALQMLRYNPCDPNTYNLNSIHKLFYNEINGLNGNGYPHLTKNIGVAFSSQTPNLTSGVWIILRGYNSWSDFWMRVAAQKKDFYLENANDEIKLAGSYLPFESTNRMSAEFGAGIVADLDRKLNPTFIPHESALDIVNGVSKFTYTIKANRAYFHDEVPPEVIDPLISLLDLKMPVFNSATISGPSIIPRTTSATFTCNASGGTPPYRYQWWIYKNGTVLNPGLRADVPNQWIPVPMANSATWVKAAPNNGDYRDFDLKCVITDAANTNLTSNIILPVITAEV